MGEKLPISARDRKMLKTLENSGTHTVVSWETTAPMKLKFCTIVGPMDLRISAKFGGHSFCRSRDMGVGKLKILLTKKKSFFFSFHHQCSPEVWGDLEASLILSVFWFRRKWYYITTFAEIQSGYDWQGQENMPTLMIGFWLWHTHVLHFGVPIKLCVTF